MSGLELRLQLLAGAEGASEGDLLRLAVQQAQAAVGGLGAVAHLYTPEAEELRLEAVSGLPEAVARRWERLGMRGGTAPARAGRDGGVVWSKTWPPVSEPDGDAGAGPEGGLGRAEWEQLGAVAVGLRVDGLLVGTVAVLTETSPAAGVRQELAQLAEVTARGLARAPVPSSSRRPWWQEGSGAPQRREGVDVPVGTWSWDLSTGRMRTDAACDRAIRVAGLTGDWDHRIETWMSRIHPDDRAAVEREIRRAQRDDDADAGDVSAITYRVRGADGRLGWVQTLAWIRRDTDGTPVTASGTAADVTAVQDRLQWLTVQQDRHPDPMCALDPDDRVVWANRAARHLQAGAGLGRVGAVPWEEERRLDGRGLPQLLRRARAADGAAVGHDIDVPGEAGGLAAAYSARAYAAGEHVVLQLVDITPRRRAEQAAADRAEQVAQLRDEMAAALHARDVADVVTRHVPLLVGASALVLYQIDGRGRSLLGETGYPPGWTSALLAQDDPKTLRTLLGDSEPDVLPTPALGRRWPHLARLADRSDQETWALMPLEVRRERVGYLLVSWSRGRQPGPEDRMVLETIGSLVAQSLARGVAFDREHARAQELRRTLRPALLDTEELHRAAVTAAARHIPGSTPDPGAWYDAIPLPGARVAFISGAVTGTGTLRSAVTMGRLRETILTLVGEDRPLDELMLAISSSATRILNGDAVSAQLLLAYYDGTTGRLELACAGAEPPLLDGEPGDVPVGPPLGVSLLPYEVAEMEMDEGSLLALSTAEPGEALARSMEEAAAAPRTEEGLEAVCDAAAAEWADRDEDEALLLAHLGRVPHDRIVSWDLEVHPASAGRGRDLAVSQMQDWQAPEDLEYATELSVSELLGNVVRHAVGPLTLRLVYLEPDLVVEVYDGSPAAPHMRPFRLLATTGRGLQMIGGMANGRWGTRYTPTGKVIWLRLSPGCLDDLDLGLVGDFGLGELADV